MVYNFAQICFKMNPPGLHANLNYVKTLNHKLSGDFAHYISGSWIHRSYYKIAGILGPAVATRFKLMAKNTVAKLQKMYNETMCQ